MSAPENCTLAGRWRIVEADIWDRDHLDLCGPATITITDHGRGEIAFGALQARLDLEYSPSSVGFTWEGFDEMDEVSGDGSAELLDHGSIEIEFAYHNGDEAVLKAKRYLRESAGGSKSAYDFDPFVSDWARRTSFRSPPSIGGRSRANGML